MTWLVTPAERTPVDKQGIGSVSLLLHGDGANGSKTITDSSPRPKTVTTVDDVQISTAQSKFGGSSIAFDGNGDRLTLAASSEWDFSGGPHTVETWARFNAFPGSGNSLRLVMAGINSRASSFVFFAIGPSGVLSCSVPLGGVNSITHSNPLSLNTWHHLAVVLDPSGSSLFLDGIRTTGSLTLPQSGINQLFIGFDTIGTVNFNFNGFIDDLRITKGVARYTSNFTPPTAPFPDI